MATFAYETFLPPALFQQVAEELAYAPERLQSAGSLRRKPRRLPPTLVLAAADHNARMITAYGGEALGLAHRPEYLARLARLLQSPLAGVEAAPDVMEALLLLNQLVVERGGQDFLSDKFLIGTVNRGGLLNTVWELDDFCSCYTPQQAAELGLDAVKFMLRIQPQSLLSRRTLEYCAETVRAAAALRLPVLIEVLFMEEKNGALSIATDFESLVKSIGVAAALGGTASQKWLELPICADYGRMAAASSCPILVVPAEREQGELAVVGEYLQQKGSSPQVRGILLGRNVLYHRTEDPFVLAEAIRLLWQDEGELTLAAAYTQALACRPGPCIIEK